MTAALAVSAFSWYWAGQLVSMIRAAHPAPRPRARVSALADLRAGLSYALREVPVRRVVMVLGAVGLLGYNWQVAVPLIARFTLHRQVTGYGALMAAGGFAGLVATITANTRLQLLVPDELRGRVMSIYVLLMQGTTPLGAFGLGALAGHLGTGTAVVTFGAATAGAIWLRRHRAAGTARGSAGEGNAR